MDNILDSLDPKELIKDIMNMDVDDSPELPELCKTCKNTIICSVLPTMLSIHRIGITLEVKSCQFRNQIPIQKN